MIQIDVVDEQQGVAVSLPRLRAAAEHVLRAEGHRSADLSIAVVNNAAMQALNCRYLNHDWPTDVLSFSFDDRPGSLSGEVIINAQLAAEVAGKFGWTAPDELLLYLVHGLLHLCGYDDADAESQSRMRRRERELLAQYGLHPVYDARDAEATAGCSGPTARLRAGGTAGLSSSAPTESERPPARHDDQSAARSAAPSGEE